MSLNIEQFCQAIEIIVSERLADISFDSTIICTIMDASDKDSGHYVVSDGTIKFDAYTNDTSYKKGDQVRVSVLNGNFNERKFIEGPYIGDDSGAPVTYISPLGTALTLEENALSTMGSPQNITSTQIYANSDNEVLIWDVDISNDTKYQKLQENGIYNTITLSADFMTNLGNLSQGNYGLILDLFIKKSKDTNEYIHKYVTFDSSEMIGNPYSFEIYSHQEKKINLASFGMISMIRLSAYEGIIFGDEDRALGQYTDNPFLDTSGQVIGRLPINIKDIKLGFGNDLISIADNTLQLYTTSSLQYNHYDHTTATNEKELGLLWLNKTEDNQYIGYSDGVYSDTPYDEIAYRELAHTDSRLMAQHGKVGIADDEESLTLAADIAEAEGYMVKAYELLTTDLSQVLQALSRQLSGAPTILDELNPLIKTWYDDSNNAQSAKLHASKYHAQQAVQKLVKFYNQILNYGYNVQNQIEQPRWNNDALTTTIPSKNKGLYVEENDSIDQKNKYSGLVNWDYKTSSGDYYSDFKKYIQEGIDTVIDFFEKETTGMIAITGPNEVLNGYAGICNTYHTRAKAVIDIINKYIDQIDKLCAGDVEKLQAYKTKTNYTSYNSEAATQSLRVYDNMYCIYWYHYVPGFTLEYDEESDDNTEYLYGNFAGPNWVRMPEYNNVGLPSTRQSNPGEDGKYYYIAQPTEDESTLSIYLDQNTQEEKIKVIMFYNHEMITSNILEFTNQHEVPDEKNVDPKDILRIEHDVDSQDHYQVYSSANDLVNISDGSKMRQLKCYYEGVLSGDETLIDSWLYWYVPTTSTLLTYDKDYLVNTLGFSTDIDGKTDYSLDNYVYFAKQVLAAEEEPSAQDEEEDVEDEIEENILKDSTRIFAYKIKPLFEPSATNNTILVKAIIPGQTATVQGEKYFTFATFGNNGTKYSFSITPATNRIGYCGSSSDWERGLSLDIDLKDANNNSIQMLKTVSSGTGNPEEESANKVGSGLRISFRAPTGRTVPEDNYNAVENSNTWNLLLSDPSWEQRETIKEFIGILEAQVSLYSDEAKRDVVLSTLYGVPYSSNPNYYIGGPTMIVYNNQGTVSRVSEEAFKLYSHTPNDTTINDVEWKLEYHDKSGSVVTEANGEKDQNNIFSYMPKLNADNTITPAPLYFTYETESGGSGSQEYYPVAKCYDKTSQTLLWSQPIIIIQNKYASAMLNNWDGSFTIDEANGTLMATMLGAGKKTANNTFEGVLIGDITAGDGFDPDNAHGIGIYGFNDGDQSFNFSTDGTAFIGKAGRGRILFNGNDGTISSASYQQNRTPIYGEDADGNEIITGYTDYSAAGMKIDLDDGYIDMVGAVRTNSSKYAPLEHRAIEINIPTDRIESISSTVVASDIGFLRYEKTWYDKNNNSQISNLLLEKRNNKNFYWKIEDIEYRTVPKTVEPIFIAIKYPAGAELRKYEHRDLYTSTGTLRSKPYPTSASASSKYYLLGKAEYVDQHIIPTKIIVTPFSDYVLVGKYGSAEEFNNDSRGKYTRATNDSNEYVYTIADTWKINTDYYVQGVDIGEDAYPENDLKFEYGYDEYIEIDMNYTLNYVSLGTFNSKEDFENNTYEKYILSNEKYIRTTAWEENTVYYTINMTSKVYDWYKELYQNNAKYNEIYVQDIDGNFIEWTFSASYVNNISFYHKIRHDFEIDIPAGYTAQRHNADEQQSRKSNIHIDVLNPYFTISSAKQSNNNYLMYVGDSKYYIQSANYKIGTFNKTVNNIEAYEGAPFHADGAGMKIDLNSGHIDAYDFNLTSKNIYLDSGNAANPFMIVRDNYGKALMYMGTNNYFLKSSDFQTMSDYSLGSGMKIDLKNGKIEAYGFNLRAGQTVENDHEIIITDNGSSSNPYLKINTSHEEKTKTLVCISKDEQYFQSQDFSMENQTGIGLNLSEKYLKAYDGFSLWAFNSNDDTKTQGVFIDSDAGIYPFQIIGSQDVTVGDTTEKASVKIAWSGQLTGVGAVFKSINVESGVLGNLSVSGTLNGGIITGATIKGGTLDIGTGADKGGVGTAAFHVNSDGSFVASSGTIGGWTVTPNSGFSSGSGSSGVYVNPDGMGFGSNFNVSEDGVLTANGAKLQSLEVYKSLTVKSEEISVPGGSTSGDGGGSTTPGGPSGPSGPNVETILPYAMVARPSIMEGGGSSAGSVDAPIVTIEGDTKIDGNTEITGTLLLDADTTIQQNLDIVATTKVGGPFYFNEDIYCTLAGGDEVKGVDGTFALDGAGVFDDVYMQFRNGILVAFTDPKGGNTVEGIKLGDLAYADYVSKKIDVTLTGTAYVSYPGGGGGTIYIYEDDDGYYCGYGWEKDNDYTNHKVTISGSSGGTKEVTVSLNKEFTADFYPSESDDTESFTYDVAVTVS